MTATATSGSVTTWTVPQSAQDISIAFVYKSANYGRILPRPYIGTAAISSTSGQFVIDHRNPSGSTPARDGNSVGFGARFSARTVLQIDTTSWANQGITPTVLVR